MSEDNKQKDLEDLQKNFKQLENELTDMVKNLGDITKFNDLSEEIQNLKNIGNPPTTNEVTDEPTNTMDTTPPPIDGETCMHGNSWNSNCSECDDLDDVEVALNEMGNIIDNEPNDTLLGQKIRDFYHKWIEFNETNSDNTNNIDI